MKNIDKIAEAIARGARHILIHPVPTTSFWLICEKMREDTWKTTLCNPLDTRYCLVSKEMSEDNRMRLWENLVKIRSPDKQQHQMLL